MSIRLTGNDTNGVAADGNGDWWITLEDEVVGNTGTAFGFAGFNFLTYTIRGTLIGNGGTGGSTASSQVLITETGVVQASFSAIVMSGDSNEIRNEGSVTATNSGDGMFINGDLGRLTNLGTTHGYSSGMQITGDNGFVINHGLATGLSNAVFLNGNNNRIENYGTLQGDDDGIIWSGTGIEIWNVGTIVGNGSKALEGSFGSQATITNEGTIIGDIRLGSGEDVYRSMAGQHTGQMNMGGGDDLVALGDGALSSVVDFDGGDGSDTLDLSNFSHGIWADLTYAGAEVWTRDNNDWADGSAPWRRLVDVTDVENIVGTAGIDLMRGTDADNTFGYIGDQFITGVETIGGRGGADTVDFSRAEFAVWVDLEFAGAEAWTQDDADATDATGAFREIADLADIENLTGSERVDALYGTVGDNVFGYHGSSAFTGVEIINGRGGTDTVDFSGFARAVWVDLAYAGAEAWTQDDFNATDTSGTFREIADLAGIENITGTDHADLIAADSGANVIEGGGGADDIYGRGGADTFVYRDDFGRDTLFDFSADDAEKIDLSDVTAITDFADLVTNHVVDIAGTAVIEVDAGNRIYLDGWTVADIGAGQPIDADDFIF